MNEFKKTGLQLKKWKYSLILGIFSIAIPLWPVVAAKEILFIYGPLEVSIDIDVLEKFAHYGTIDPALKWYLSQVNAEQRDEFREALSKRYKLNPVQVSRFFNSDLGEEILDFLGRYITLEGGRNGKYALRAAMIQAAFEPNGLSLINVLVNLPTNVEIEGEKLLELIKHTRTVFKSTVLAPEFIGQLATQEAKSGESIDFSQLPDLRQYGALGFQKERWELKDASRNRSFFVLVYKPQQWRSPKTPVIIFSHGLAARPEDYEERAKYLASYGFVVAIPQHPGSDFDYIQNVLSGYAKDFIPLSEFIDRPQDITFLLDELERRNPTEFEGRLDLENVGILGHSFGGYTALALAGAEIDFEFLQKDCENKFAYLDLARLVQCRALKLPRKDYQFRDPRVKAIVVRNAVNRSLFGPKGLAKIQIPVVYFSGSYDPLTHPVFEQIYPFIWLKTPHKYLALEEGQAHVDFVALDVGLSQALESLPEFTLPHPEVLASYKNTTILAFFEVYLTQNLTYRPYLQSSYAAYLSHQEPFKFYWISAASVEPLQEGIRKFRKREGLPDL